MRDQGDDHDTSALIHGEERIQSVRLCFPAHEYSCASEPEF